jgi:predicted dehydrogenase
MMECVWIRFLPAINNLEYLLAQDIIGEIRTVKANFSINGDFHPKHRLPNKCLAGGALLDLCIYPLTLASIVFGETPTHIQSSAIIGEDGVDESFCYLLEYEQNKRAILSASFIEHAPTEAIISGSKGYIRIPHFLGAQESHLHLDNQPSRILTFPFEEGEKFTFEIVHAMKCIRHKNIKAIFYRLKKPSL